MTPPPTPVANRMTQPGSGKPYAAGQLSNLLNALQQRRVSGILRLTTLDPVRPCSTMLVLKDGKLIYGGSKLLTSDNVLGLIKQELKGEWTDVVIASAASREKSTPQAVLERLVHMHLCTWEQVERVFLRQLVMALEPFVLQAGVFQLDLSSQLPIISGFDVPAVLSKLSERQQRWQALSPGIPNQDGILELTAAAHIALTDPKPLIAASDLKSLQALNRVLNVPRSVHDLAMMQKMDPLRMAESLQRLVTQGWLMVKQPGSSDHRATILTVDDSDLMRQLISRILGDHYRVLTANNAMTALAVLNEEAISLVLLDVSMPGIDGLELCRCIRNLSRFQKLPIVMVTARDGFFDKVKGRVAGATDYLTKPFEAEQLQQIAGRYVQKAASVSS